METAAQDLREKRWASGRGLSKGCRLHTWQEHTPRGQHVAWGGESRVWSPSVGVSITHKLKPDRFQVSEEFLLPKNLSAGFGPLTPFLGEALLRGSPDVIPSASLPQVPCLDPTGSCLFLSGLT